MSNAVRKPNLTAQIMLGMLIGAVAGILFMLAKLPEPDQPALLVPLLGLVPLFLEQPIVLVGDLFIQALRMIIIPLIVASMIIGVVETGGARHVGRLGGQMMALFVGMGLFAAALGTALVAIIRPGAGMTAPALGDVREVDPIHWTEMVKALVPPNPIASAAQMDLIGVIVFALLVGAALLFMEPKQAAPMVDFMRSLNAVMMRLVGWVIRLAPLGIGALIVRLFAEQAPEDLLAVVTSMALYCGTVFVGAVILLLVYGLMLAVFSGMSPARFLRDTGEAMATAFGTASSAATMPVTFRCVERLGVSRRIRGFVIPIGATAHMDGTALYQVVAIGFIAQVLGISLPMTTLVLVMFAAVMGAIGTAGVPQGGLIAMTITMGVAGIPYENIALVVAVDRVVDMMRTSINVTGDAVVARVLQSWNPKLVDEDEGAPAEAAAGGTASG